MTNYRRVTERDRYQIEAWMKSQVCVSQMARWLGFHKTSIYREIQRNRFKSIYQADRAQKRRARRFYRCRRKIKMDPQLEQRIFYQLQMGLSPEQIDVRCQKEQVTCVSFSTMYRFFRQKKHHRFKVLLRCYNQRGAGRMRQRRRIASMGYSILQRPMSANLRTRLGHWERDTMYIQNQKQILVCTDRKSRFTFIHPLIRIDTQSVAQQTQKILREMPYHTMTNDNGPEFRSKMDIGVPVYFCQPRKPQQRGTIENTIGLLRQYIKRKTNIQELTKEKINWIQNRINHRPRKCLDFNTPYEIFFNKKVALAMTT